AWLWLQGTKTGDNIRPTVRFGIASLGGSAFALLLLSLSNIAAFSASQCGQESTPSDSQSSESGLFLLVELYEQPNVKAATVRSHFDAAGVRTFLCQCCPG